MDLLCRLCRAPGELRRSHILPEFLYRPLYDEKHRFFVLTAGVDGQRQMQRGLTEKLLCDRCEQQLGRYEKYAAAVMSGRLQHRYCRAGNRITISNIDYAHFKLFQLSILWRASVSSLEFFRLVALGPHEERLRNMLLHEELGVPHTFGCVVVFASERGEDISDTFFNPESLRWCGRRIVKFFFAGSAWLFHCDSRPAPAYLQQFFLQQDGSLTGLRGDLADTSVYGVEAKRLARRARF